MGVEGQDILGGGGGWHDGHVTPDIHQSPQNILFDSKIVGHDAPGRPRCGRVAAVSISSLGAQSPVPVVQE